MNYILLKLGKKLLIVSFILHTFVIISRLFEVGYFPITSQHESISFLAWSILFIYIVLDRKSKHNHLGIIISPLLMILMSIASVLLKDITHIPPILKSQWLLVHGIFSFLAEGIFTIAFATSVFYLFQERSLKMKKRITLFQRGSPSLEALDEFIFLCIRLGFPLMTAGIITGSIWANTAWNSYWSWDPKETWSLITWIIYAALLHQRINMGWRGKKAAWMAVVGFISVLFTFFGVNLVLPSLHSYSSLSLR
jgi:cytochrome c-type biogenesis protein CcsB